MINETSFADIPQELKERRQWVCYRLELRDGSKTKVPYQPTQGGPLLYARSNDPSTWHPFEDAVEATRIPQNQFNGIQYVLSDSDPYTFIDLDYVVTDGVVEEWAQDIVDDVGSYTELSQSGTGIHIIARAKKPGPRCNTSKFPKLEIYDDKRLVVFTGKLCPGAPTKIRDAQKSIDELYLRVFGKNERLSHSTQMDLKAVPVDVSDSALIEKAKSARNGDKFTRLWDGDTADHRGDDSAADLALCRRLAFWTHCDVARMDRLFRQSGLMRPKWDERRGERTYGQRTLDAAIDKTQEGYDGHSGKHAGGQATEAELAAEMHSQDGAIPQLDIGHPKQKPEQVPAIDSSALPDLELYDRQIRDIGEDAIRFLREVNDPPVLFRRCGLLCQLIEDENGAPALRVVTEEILLCSLAKTCNFMKRKLNVPPPKSIAPYILSETSLPFPFLEAVTRTPIIRPDGSIVQGAGYDPPTKLYYHQSVMQDIEVPDRPSGEDVEEARKLLDEMLYDFPFDSESSKANMIALLVTAIMRPAISGVLPLFLVDAPVAGSGKSLLAELVGMLCSGAMPKITTAPSKEDEWSKLITSLLASGPSLFILDNISSVLQSAALASVITSGSRQDRVFGKNTETVTFPNLAGWLRATTSSWEETWPGAAY